MSVDLGVKLTCPVSIASILSGTREALKGILSLSHTAAIHAEDCLSETPTDSSAFLETTTGTIKIYIDGYPEDPAFLFVSTRTGEPLTEEGSGNFAVVEMHGQSLGNLVGAAIAIAIARECGSDIEDNLPYFSDRFEQSAAEFLDAVKQRKWKEEIFPGQEVADFRD